MEQIKFEEEASCYISFDLTKEGKLVYDINQWKKVEGKLKSAWANGNVFDISCRIYFNTEGMITQFTMSSQKKGKVKKINTKLSEVEIEYSANRVFAEVGDIARAVLISILTDIRAGYLPRVLQELQSLDLTKMKVKLAYQQTKVHKLMETLRKEEEQLKKFRQQLQEVIKNEK